MTDVIIVGSRVTRKPVNNFKSMSGIVGTVVDITGSGRAKIKWDVVSGNGQQHSTIQLKFLTTNVKAMTKEEIIHQYNENSGYDGGFSESDVEKMMDEWAKVFGSWCLKYVNQPNFDIPSLYLKFIYQQERSSLK